ncbi:MAG: hypothetical protein JHC34_05820 [Acidobacteria bacterium]|nr:hypothetical protein [Acidobacteriota bacterium]
MQFHRGIGDVAKCCNARYNVAMRRSALFVLALSLALGCQAAAPDLGPLERQVEILRGLKFKSPVVVRAVDQAGIRAAVASQLDLETSAPDWPNEVAALKAFGLIPRKMDMKRTLAGLLDSQVAGLYDPRAKVLYVSNDAGSEIDDELGLSGLILPDGFSTHDVFVVHELDHALTDQHFNLLSLPLDDASNGDRASAARCVVEGDATYVMARYAATALKMTDAQIELLSDLSNAMAIGKQLLPSYPDYIQEELLVSYLAGYELVKEVKAKRGEKGVDDLYRHPPASMEQVLHPEKYLAGNDPPVALKAEPPANSPLKLKRRIFGSVWGEFDTRLILQAWGVPAAEAESAAEGWGGDAFSIFQAADGSTGFYWATAWDTERDAIEFAAAASRATGVTVERDGRRVAVTCLSGPPLLQQSHHQDTKAPGNGER